MVVHLVEGESSGREKEREGEEKLGRQGGGSLAGQTLERVSPARVINKGEGREMSPLLEA